MKKGKAFTDDKQLKKRFEEMKDYFLKGNTYAQFDNYYIELRQIPNDDGYRWFHRGKYKIEVVFDREHGPSRNEAGFVLFSNFEDAILHACLIEDKFLTNFKRDEIRGVKA